jgi:hypothetical protein
VSPQVELADILAAVQAVVGSVTGIRYAPDSIPGDISQYPASIVYPKSGRYITGKVGISVSYHNIVVEIHIPLKDLARDVTSLLPYCKSVPEALTADPTLSKHIENSEQISYTFGQMEYNGAATIGWRFVIENIKIYPYGMKD